MNYFAAYLLASSISFGTPVAIQDGANWTIYTNDEPKIVHSYLYNRTHVEAVGGVFVLDKNNVQKLDHCHIEYRKNRSWHIVDGVSYFWELKVVHSHAVDKHFPMSGRIKINGKNIDLLGEVVRPKTKLIWDHDKEQGYEILWPDINLMLNYTENEPHGSYSFYSDDIDIPSGHKVLVEFDYAYSYDSISREKFSIYADCRKDFDIYFSKAICEIPLKISKKWTHVEYMFKMPENSNEFNFKFTAIHPSFRHTTYIRNFKYKDLNQNDKP